MPREERNRWGPSAVTRRLHGPSAARGHPRRAPSTQFLAPAMIPDRRSTMDPVKAGANGHGDPRAIGRVQVLCNRFRVTFATDGWLGEPTMASLRGCHAMNRYRPPDDLTAPSACERVRASATDYLEGAVAPSQRRALDTHLAHCPDCRRYYDDIRRTIALVRCLRDEELPAEITGSPDEVRRRRGDT